MKKPKRKLITRRLVKNGQCPFCMKASQPNYLNAEELSVYISDRAKIIAKDYTGLCAKHQRKLGIAIKRARHLAILPFRPQM